MASIANIYGAGLAGAILNSWVFGLQCVLSYGYYSNFPCDRLGTKLLVAWIWALQLFNAIVVSKMMYSYLITSWGHIPEQGIQANWEWPLYTGLSSIAAFSVQAYYARRTHLLIKSHLLFGIILALAIFQLGFGLATMSEAYKLVYLADYTSVGHRDGGNLDARRTVRAIDSECDTFDLDNLQSSRDCTLKIKVEKNQVVNPGSPVDSYPSTATKVSEFHANSDVDSRHLSTESY
ncbi:hypothetical protein H0H92_000196 [Tricholoma furcatifolium]|nr:hypothetical protein H0H92_000196 [Tricholoma furcatifolium]